MNLYHLSHIDNLTIKDIKKCKDIRTEEFLNKPDCGLWVSWNMPGENITFWEDWAYGNEFYDIKTYKYEIVLKTNAKVLLLNSPHYYSVQQFVRKDYLGQLYLDYKQLSKYYDVIGITFYPKISIKKLEVNFYAWDVPSAVILNMNVIKGIIPVNK